MGVRSAALDAHFVLPNYRDFEIAAGRFQLQEGDCLCGALEEGAGDDKTCDESSDGQT